MIQITNRKKHPVQLIVRSFKEIKQKDKNGVERGSGSKNFTTLIIPGIGSGHNTYLLPDEKYTPYIDRLEKDLKWITVKHI